MEYIVTPSEAEYKGPCEKLLRPPDPCVIQNPVPLYGIVIIR